MQILRASLPFETVFRLLISFHLHGSNARIRPPKRRLGISELISQHIRVRFQICDLVCLVDGLAVHLVDLLGQCGVYPPQLLHFRLRVLHHLRHLVFGVLLYIDAHNLAPFIRSCSSRPRSLTMLTTLQSP